MTSYSFEVTLPYAVTFTSVPTGWAVARVSGTRYRFTPSPAIVKTVVAPHTASPSGSGPGVAIPASGVFVATIPANSFTSGQQVKSATYDFSPHYAGTYTTAGANCAPRNQQASWATTLSIKPL